MVADQTWRAASQSGGGSAVAADNEDVKMLKCDTAEICVNGFKGTRSIQAAAAMCWQV